jgi:CubicO group peptidase (beta-lactamase class C family)
VLRAVDAGRVGLDDRIADVLPELDLAREPEWAAEATVRDLLSHQSGLWDYTPWSDAPADGALETTLRGAFAENEWATTPPGVAYNYANPNYAVLGAVLEHAYARPYAEVMQREVYAPLRLHDTFARRADAVRTGRAVWGYGLSRTQLSGQDYFDLAGASVDDLSPAWVPPAEEVDNAFLRPAGLSWSTAEDECRVGVFLLEGQRGYLRAATRRELLTPQTELTPGVPEVAYSFGLLIGDGLPLGADEWYDVPLWTHDGATPTMSSTFLVLPEQRFVLSVLRNAPESPDSLTALLATTVRQYAGLPAKQPAPPVVPPDSGARYAGTYADPQAFGTLELSWDGTHLTVSAPALESLGVTVDPTVIVARPNVLVLTVDGQPIELTVWPSASSDAGYLVAREDAFVRTAD